MLFKFFVMFGVLVYTLWLTDVLGILERVFLINEQVGGILLCSGNLDNLVDVMDEVICFFKSH